MAVTLREIIKQVQHLEMKLVAGEAGLDHEVSWTHMVDSDTISAFLQGQELTFTTGLGLNEKSDSSSSGKGSMAKQSQWNRDQYRALYQ